MNHPLGFNLSHFKWFKHRDAGSNSESSNNKEMYFCPLFWVEKFREVYPFRWKPWVSYGNAFKKRTLLGYHPWPSPPTRCYQKIGDIYCEHPKSKSSKNQQNILTSSITIQHLSTRPNKNCRPPPATDFGDGSGLQRDVQKGGERIQCDHCGINVAVDVPRSGSGIIKVPNVEKNNTATLIPWEQFYIMFVCFFVCHGSQITAVATWSQGSSY